jgi:hypothetical protein
MKFIFENNEYRISFQHFTEEREIRNQKRIIRGTTARIRTGERDSESERLVTEGKVTVHYKDTFSYEIGRRQALNHALDGQPRAFRKAAGDAYRLRKLALNTKPSTVTASAV